MVLTKHHSDHRYNLPCSVSGWCFRIRAAIMGVSVRETNAENMMVTASVHREFAEQAAHDIRHEQQGNQHRD